MQYVKRYHSSPRGGFPSSVGFITRQFPSKISSTMPYCSQANAIGLGIVITDALLSQPYENNERLVK